MAYEVTLSVLLKPSGGKRLTNSQVRKIIDNALWKCEEFRDVDIIEFKADFDEDPNPFSDIRPQILEESRAASSKD